MDPKRRSVTQNANRVMQQQAGDAELYLKYEIDSLIRGSHRLPYRVFRLMCAAGFRSWLLLLTEEKYELPHVKHILTGTSE